MASYALHFQAPGRDVGGKRVEEKLDLGRATHFFPRETQGTMRILHEAFSVPSRPRLPLIRWLQVRPSS
ncbi:MAG: hypothetical protein DMG56_17760 [Acidobacteria bacterium]|nr:MAG: hypothetical protein DMG53_23090 [Acidobacteriota bacterium]PYU44767.1 MAG: hypothetical protein DMG54_08070 [Acidobacteriota bacterium]PYU59572.1 MAG: hypothetical protein DMG56_17760 [Acidobacteriota bacterium]PYU70539.1 MAG: hypothetical protein DMG52_25225 [Acidobacteriota bacterium]